MKKRNLLMEICYDGTKYYGWQRLGKEGNENTIQGKLEEILSRFFQEEIKVIGSGRTDAGVHAHGQQANFFTTSTLSCEVILSKINAFLPKDIGILSIQDVPPRFHSRIHAKEKTYLYRIGKPEVPHVFDRKYVWTYPESLDVSAMKEGACLLLGTHDFKGFSSIKKTKKSTIRTLYQVQIDQTPTEIQIHLTGNGFLYNMVRIIVGTLVEIGQHTRPVNSVSTIFQSRCRKDAGMTAPPQGLFLEQVIYPSLETLSSK